MEHTKSSIRTLLAKGETELALSATLEYAEFCGLTDIVNGLTTLSNRTALNQEQFDSGLVKYDDFILMHTQAAFSLTNFIDRLPDQAVASKPKRKPLQETTFKNRIFYAILIIKVIVLLRLAYHWSTGGFNDDQFYATVGLLAPAFAAYITVMLDDYLRLQKTGVLAPRYLSGPLVTFSYWLFPVYAMILLTVIEMKVPGRISFPQMNLFLALTESVLGVYIGKIVFAFFKKDQ